MTKVGHDNFRIEWRIRELEAELDTLNANLERIGPFSNTDGAATVLARKAALEHQIGQGRKMLEPPPPSPSAAELYADDPMVQRMKKEVEKRRRADLARMEFNSALVWENAKRR